MTTSNVAKKPHAVCIPFPVQSHIKGMLKLAKLLHNKGVYITFVNTEFNHKRFLKTRGQNSLDGLPDFRFKTIPDGLPPSEMEATQDIPSLCESTRKHCLAPFLDLCGKFNQGESSNVPPLTSIVSDGFMTFTIDAAQSLGVPVIHFWTLAACGFMGFYQYHILLEKGLAPLGDAGSVTNGHLDKVLDWIPGMNGIRLKDLPNLSGTVFNFVMEAAQRSTKASATILHTFDNLEPDLVHALSSILSNVFTIGPLQLLLNQVPQGDHLKSIGYSLWKEEPLCLQWLNSKQPNSVVYVNFGSIAVISAQHLVEFCWGLANSSQSFLWIIRPDLVAGETANLPPEFVEGTKGRGFFASWCPQEEVLHHPSVGGFLTHGGWNSTLESLSAGVPMICLPFFGDQTTNCRYMCKEWACGLEIDSDLKRDEVEKVVTVLMEEKKARG